MQALGVYVDGEHLPHQVVVVGLSREACEIEEDPVRATVGSRVEFWIGGLGPFGGLTEALAEERLSIRFTAPLEPAIVDHFSAC